jgi:hypothetical protein
MNKLKTKKISISNEIEEEINAESRSISSKYRYLSIWGDQNHRISMINKLEPIKVFDIISKNEE